ncbi:MAG: PRC-barrel domain containing protein [Acidobacteria bacterium]|nr:PRC-barrel domain containing protein [Acidobacteriota bacterium]
MSEITEFTIGSDVTCSDGSCGELRRVVVDPVARVLTHLVVEAKHRQGLGHLVPIALVSASGAEIHLRCTVAQFEALEDAEETQFLPGAHGPWGYEQDQILSHPYYGLGMSGLGGTSIMGGMGMSMNNGPQPITADRVPVGEVEVRRGEHVYATDGPIGQVQGLVVDPSDHHVTHVLLDEGHLWGKKRVAIPIGAVTSVSDGVRVNLTKDEVGDLAPVDLADDE